MKGVPFKYALTITCVRARFKDSYVLAVRHDGEKLRIPYKDFICGERLDTGMVRITYNHRSRWNFENMALSKPKRLNDWIVKCTRPNGSSVYIRKKK